jgi:DNA-binding NarL/FixJ family response regulator
MTISVLIADDHPVVAEGLKSLLEAQEDIQVMGVVEDGREAVRVAVENPPDIVIMDNAMPLLNGTEATRMLRERLSHTQIIMLSMYSDPVHVYRAFQAGAAGYIVKKSVAKEVVEAIRKVQAGGRYLSKQLVDPMLDHIVFKSTAEEKLGTLSSRERQVLQLLAEGHGVSAIAGTLSLSPKTVETYRARMMEKLGIHDIAGLVRFAIQQGISPLD